MSCIAGRFCINWATREALKRCRLTRRCPGRGASSKQGPDISLCLSKDKTCWKNGSLLRWPRTPAESEEAKQLRKKGKRTGCWSANIYTVGFPCGSAGKESACNVEDLGWVPGSGRCPGEGKGNPLQYSGLENSMDCIVHGVAESDTLSDFHFHWDWGLGTNPGRYFCKMGAHRRCVCR